MDFKNRNIGYTYKVIAYYYESNKTISYLCNYKVRDE